MRLFLIPVLCLAVPASAIAAAKKPPVVAVHKVVAAHNTVARAAPRVPQHKVAKPKPETQNGPRSIGVFGDWQAATTPEAGQSVCYAFVRLATSASAGGKGHEDIVLTVTQRSGSRDAVAISTGVDFAPNTEVTMDVGSARLSFYTAQRSAFARDGHAVVGSFAHAAQAVVHMPVPHGDTMAEHFSLKGFPQAYAAINKACPK